MHEFFPNKFSTALRELRHHSSGVVSSVELAYNVQESTTKVS